METFGQKIKYLRKVKNITQEQLAKDLFIDKSTIAKYETDKIEPSMTMLKKFAQYFDVSSDYLLDLRDY